MTMRIYYKLILSALTMLLLASCIKEGRSDSCPANLKVIYNWDEADPILESDSLVIIGADGKVYNLKTQTEGSELDLPDGKYLMVAYEPNPNVEIEGNQVTAYVHPDGSIYDLTPFRAGINTFDIKAGEANKPLVIVMRKQTRLLQIKVHFIGAGLEFLNGVTSQLTGVTLSRKIDEGFPPADREPRHPAIASTTAYFDFDKVPTRSAREVSLQQDYNSEKNLLGLDGSVNQVLSLSLQLNTQLQELELNLTEENEDFNVIPFHIDKVDEPFVIELTIRLGADMTADIVDWESGAESDLDAH